MTPQVIKTTVLPNADGNTGLPRLTSEQTDKMFMKLDLSGIDKWAVEHQKEIRGLIKEFGSLFTLDDLDLGKTVIIKHSIKLTDSVPFKKRYGHIPPHQCKEVKNTCRKCWPLEPLENHAAPGLAHSYWCERRMEVYTSV